METPRNLPEAVEASLRRSPHVVEVRFVGSRAAGTPTRLSDWDFDVRTDDFPEVAEALPELVAGLGPLAQQWDRLSPTACYMLMQPGPAKVDLIFTDVSNQPSPPWEATAENLVGIDRHFWDWILWLAAKDLGGKHDLVAEELEKMSRHILRPMGVSGAPASVPAAIADYLATRERLESRLRVSVPRRLEREVLPVLPRD